MKWIGHKNFSCDYLFVGGTCDCVIIGYLLYDWQESDESVDDVWSDDDKFRR